MLRYLSSVLVPNKFLHITCFFDIPISPPRQFHMPVPDRALWLFIEVDLKLNRSSCYSAVSFSSLSTDWAYYSYLYEIKHDSMFIRAHLKNNNQVVACVLSSVNAAMDEKLPALQGSEQRACHMDFSLCISQLVELEFLWPEEWLTACIQKTCCPCIQNILLQYSIPKPSIMFIIPFSDHRYLKGGSMSGSHISPRITYIKLH